MERTLETVRIELKTARHKFLNGDNTAKPLMLSLAAEAADLFNAKAKEVAKRMGVRPRLTNAEKIMRQGEFLR